MPRLGTAEVWADSKGMWNHRKLQYPLQANSINANACMNYTKPKIILDTQILNNKCLKVFWWFAEAVSLAISTLYMYYIAYLLFIVIKYTFICILRIYLLLRRGLYPLEKTQSQRRTRCVFSHHRKDCRPGL